MMHSLFMEENYLEAIYIVFLRKEEVRNVDIVKEKKLAKSSVSAAIQKLCEQGYITYEDDKIIRFTESGLKIAKKMYERHKFITDMFVKMGIAQEIAEDEACQIEHIISEESFEKIKKYCNNR